MEFTKNFTSGFFGGEGFILQVNKIIIIINLDSIFPFVSFR
jgi:hypothetical protein